MHDIADLDDAVANFAKFMAPDRRSKLMRRIALALKSENKKRMQAQESPDGDAWAERKNPPKPGRPRKMMAGLKKHLKHTSSANHAAVGFKGYAAKIALVHHRGLEDFITSEGPKVRYEMREILGIADGDADLISDLFLEAAQA